MLLTPTVNQSVGLMFYEKKERKSILELQSMQN